MNSFLLVYQGSSANTLLECTGNIKAFCIMLHVYCIIAPSGVSGRLALFLRNGAAVHDAAGRPWD
jgi:hypothetical protein